jgi:integrase
MSLSWEQRMWPDTRKVKHIRLACDIATPPGMLQEHTPGHLNCGACAGALMQAVSLSASMSYTEAARSFLDSRATLDDAGRIRYVAKRTFTDYESMVHMTSQFFGTLRLDQIEPYHFRSYQKMRAEGDGFVRRIGGKRKGFVEIPTACGPAKINDELDLVARIMLRAAAWTPQHAAHYRKLQEPDNDIPRALAEEEQVHFLRIAGSNPDWHLVWWYSLAALDLGFSSDEMRTLRQGDVNMGYQIVSVNRNFGKNSYRRRSVPILGADGVWAFERLLERSRALVGSSPSSFLFPKREVRGVYDGTEPMTRTGIRKSFEEVRDAAGLPWFCINGWRHTAATRMAESGVSFPMMQERLGHVSAKMTRHYMHISAQAQRRVIGNAMYGKRAPLRAASMTEHLLHRPPSERGTVIAMA